MVFLIGLVNMDFYVCTASNVSIQSEKRIMRQQKKVDLMACQYCSKGGGGGVDVRRVKSEVKFLVGLMERIGLGSVETGIGSVGPAVETVVETVAYL